MSTPTSLADALRAGPYGAYDLKSGEYACVRVTKDGPVVVMARIGTPQEAVRWVLCQPELEDCPGRPDAALALALARRSQMDGAGSTGEAGAAFAVVGRVGPDGTFDLDARLDEVDRRWEAFDAGKTYLKAIRPLMGLDEWRDD